MEEILAALLLHYFSLFSIETRALDNDRQVDKAPLSILFLLIHLKGLCKRDGRDPDCAISRANDYNFVNNADVFCEVKNYS